MMTTTRLTTATVLLVLLSMVPTQAASTDIRSCRRFRRAGYPLRQPDNDTWLLPGRDQKLRPGIFVKACNYL